MEYMVRTLQAACILGLVVLAGCANTTPLSPIAPARFSTSQDQATIQALHRRLHEREQTLPDSTTRLRSWPVNWMP